MAEVGPDEVFGGAVMLGFTKKRSPAGLCLLDFRQLSKAIRAVWVICRVLSPTYRATGCSPSDLHGTFSSLVTFSAVGTLGRRIASGSYVFVLLAVAALYYFAFRGV